MERIRSVFLIGQLRVIFYVNFIHGVHGMFNKSLIDNNLIDHDRDASEEFYFLLGKEP